MFVTGEGAPYGVDITTGGIADSYANFVWEPAVVKVVAFLYVVLHSDSNVLCGWCLSKFINLQINAINAATEAACLVLSVDETVKNPKVND